MAYIALYRKWRPKTFTDVVGQKQVSETLMRAIREGKVAHAYLFAGPRGTGKTSMAKIFARAINCEHGPTDHPCNVCRSCTQILQGDSMDVIEIDAASNRGIDEVRALRENAKFLPVDGRKKIFIIDEAHMLTNEAWNALLKTIEEPPEHVMFIFATTEAHKLPVTIISRCQRYTFRYISVEDMTNHLLYVAKESHIRIEPSAAQLIAVQADGGLRDALSILDQCSGMTDEAITVDTVVDMMGLVGKEQILDFYEALYAGNGALLLETIKTYISEGREPIQIVEALAEHVRCLLLYKVMPQAGELQVYTGFETQFQEQAEQASVSQLDVLMSKLQKIQQDAKLVENPRIIIEMGMLSLCANIVANEASIEKRLAAIEMNQQHGWDNMVHRVCMLENDLKSGNFVQPRRTIEDGLTTQTMPNTETMVTHQQRITTSTIARKESSIERSAVTSGESLAEAFSKLANGRKLALGVNGDHDSQSKKSPTVGGQGEEVVIGQTILPPKEYNPLHKYLAKHLAQSGYPMQSGFIQRGILIYVDESQVVFTFKGKSVVDIMLQSISYNAINGALNSILHRQVTLKVLEEGNPAVSTYKAASLGTISQNKQHTMQDDKNIHKDSHSSKKDEVTKVSIEESSISQVEDFATAPVEDFATVAVEDFSSSEPDFAVEAVDDFYENVPPIEDDHFASDAEEIDLDDFYDTTGPRQVGGASKDDRGVLCDKSHIERVAKEDPAFAAALKDLSEGYNIYVEIVDGDK